MKNAVIVIETICIIGLLIVCVNFYNRLPSNVYPNEKFQSMKEPKNEDMQNTSNDQLMYAFYGNKMKVKMDDSIYGDVRYDSIEGITIILEDDGKATVTVIPDNEVYKMLYPDTEVDIQNQELTGFDGKIASVYFANFGDDIAPCKILFLMEDGSVEYIDSEKMIKSKDQKYVSEGRIEELSNIVRFENVAVAFEDENGEREGGTLTVVAVDKDGYSYDLGQLINNREEK